MARFPTSIFFPAMPDATKRENRARRDGFGGIGIKFRKRGRKIVVTEVMEDGPAETAGLRAGDIITHVGDMDIGGMAARDIARRLRGPIDSAVSVTLKRGKTGELADISMVRSHIIPKTVFTSYDNQRSHGPGHELQSNTTRALRKTIVDVATREGGFQGVDPLDLREIRRLVVTVD